MAPNCGMTDLHHKDCLHIPSVMVGLVQKVLDFDDGQDLATLGSN